MNPLSLLPPLPRPPRFPLFREREEEEETNPMDDEFSDLPFDCKRQALNYINHWRKQDVEESVDRWVTGLTEFGAPPGPQTKESYRKESLRKINSK